VAEEERAAAGVEAHRALQAVQNFGGVVDGGAQVEVDSQVAPEEAAGPAFAPSMTKPRRLASCLRPYTRERRERKNLDPLGMK
jgi:hypothetical protein